MLESYPIASRIHWQAAAAEVTAGSSSENVDDSPAEEASESVNKNIGAFGENDAGEATLPQSSQVNWINAHNHVSEKNRNITNVEAIIIDAIASIESIEVGGYRRFLKCKHCKRTVVECDFSNHICGYNRGLQTQDKRYEYYNDTLMKWRNITQIERFTDEVCARVEPGSSETLAILSL